MGEATLVDSDTSPTLPQRSPANTPKYRRLTGSDLGVLLKLHKDGISQVEIAKRLGCSQPAIAQWLEKLTDSTEPAKLYLRGQALRMAQNIVKKGRAADHIKALEGIEVLSNQDVKGGLTIVVGGSAQVQVNVGTRVAEVTLSPSSSCVSGETGENR